MAAVDYSSQSYWRDRLSREKDDGFEWLLPSADILSAISEVVADINSIGRPISILHFGCGSSTLGRDLQQHLGDGVAVADADYASSSLHTRGSPSTLLASSCPVAQVPLFEVDVLDLNSLKSITPPDGWDMLVDKSTADAISCSAPLPQHSLPEHSVGDAHVEALDLLCDNLGAVASRHCRWVSISYSESRFDFLKLDSKASWQVVTKFPARLQPTLVVKDGRVVHQPPTGTWVWVLARR